MKKKDRRSKADESALTRICQSIQHDEISFETWESCMSALNLSVPVFVTAAEAAAGTDKMVKFTRSVTAAGDEKIRKEPAEVLVTVPSNAPNGLQLKCSGLGDARCDRRGDLLVIVRIKH